jgi:hypothetical protein
MNGNTQPELQQSALKNMLRQNRNHNRIAKFGIYNAWWWLRTPGRVGVKAVYIHGDGNIGIQGNNILKGNISDGRCTGGVRPALWLRLDI